MCNKAKTCFADKALHTALHIGDSMTKKHLFSTDKGVQAIKKPAAGRVTYKDALMPGLSLNVSSTGVKVWYGIVRNHQGKTERQKLGHYLGVGQDGLSLDRARQIVETARHRARAGLPPWAEFRGQSDRTFDAVRSRFFSSYVDRNLKPNTQKAYRSALCSKDLDDWAGVKVTDIARRDVHAVLDRIVERGAEVQANRVLAYLRKFFNWCAEKDILPEGHPVPTDRVKPPLKREQARDRVLSDDEIVLVWMAAGKIGYPFQQIIRLMLATGQRKQEIAGLRRREIDRAGAVWRQTENKAARIHLVPLSGLALRVLDDTPSLPIRNKTLIFSTTGATPPSGFSKAKRNLDKEIQALVAEMEDAPDGVFEEGWQFHDLRRTVTTHMRRLGVPQHVCARILNHAERGVTGMVYDQYDMLSEKAGALETWGRYLEGLLDKDQQASNVVVFKKSETEGAATRSVS